MKETIIIDWVKDVVEPWFNSHNLTGGFITTVTNYNLFNNLTDIGVVTVYADGSFQRPPIKREVRKWFRNHIRHLVKDIEKPYTGSQDGCRIIVLNGCTPQQDCIGGMLDDLKAYVNLDKDKWLKDEDALLRLTGKFKAHFTSESQSVLFPEPFFNVYMDDLWAYCSRQSDKLGAHFVSSDKLCYGDMVKEIDAYFPQGTVKPYVPSTMELGLGDDDAGLIVIRDTINYFNELFSKANVGGRKEIDGTLEQILEQAKQEVKDSLMKAI